MSRPWLKSGPAGRAPAVGGALAAGRAAGLAAGLAAAAYWSGLRWNASASIPPGLYRLSHRPARRGDLVLACPPEAASRLALERRYLPRGACPGGTQPLGKRLLAVAGDGVELSPGGIAVGGIPAPVPGSRPLARDTAGRPLAAWPSGRRTLGAGQVWLFAPHPRSFDSRYFGPVAAADCQGVLLPVWTP
jgi:conjugative transfer signal peptidase TraF